MKRVLLTLFFVTIFTTFTLAQQVNIYLSPSGKDSNIGTKERPVKTVEKAQQLASSHFGKREINFIFTDGIYYLSNSIKILPQHSANSQSKVVYRAENSGKAIISGGKLLNLKWKKCEDGIFQAKIGEDIVIDQLYINGKRKPMARYPNIVEGKNIFDCWNLGESSKSSNIVDMFNADITKRWSDPEGAYIHAMHPSLWGDMHWIVTGRDENGELTYEGGWQNNRPRGMHSSFRFIENIREELDVPNEWFFDKKEGILYYYPAEDESVDDVTVEVVLLERLFDFCGDIDNIIENNNIEGFVFRHTARTFMDNREPLLRSDWTIYRGGAVTYNGAVNCEMRDCEFDQVGGNGVFVNNYNRNLLFYGCYLHEGGANGFAFVGDPATVRSPLFRYGDQDYEKMDRERGPKGENYPANCRVDNSLIVKSGRVEKQTSPVQISMSLSITISNCSIYDVPRAGINISEGTFGGHIIENCDIFNTVLETGDHGSFNSWGRDRFWTPDIEKCSEEVEKSPELPLLDILAPIIIRNNRFRCDHGWDIDLDDGSTYYKIYNNLLLNGGLKLREGYLREVTNNIILNNSLHPHVWYKNCEDIFKHNIVLSHYKQVGMNRDMSEDSKWGKEMDYNLFMGGDRERLVNINHDCDKNSLSGDAQFIDPENGDFRVKESSPALKVGFVNFNTDSYGVKIAKLRKIAKSPEIPNLEHLAKDYCFDFIVVGGSKMKSIETLGEQSAVGLGDQCGVIVLSTLEFSPLSSAGIKINDVIIAVNGEKVCNKDDLKRAVDAMKGSEIKFTIWRNQKSLEIKTNL